MGKGRRSGCTVNDGFLQLMVARHHILLAQELYLLKLSFVPLI